LDFRQLLSLDAMPLELPSGLQPEDLINRFLQFHGVRGLHLLVQEDGALDFYPARFATLFLRDLDAEAQAENDLAEMGEIARISHLLQQYDPEAEAILVSLYPDRIEMALFQVLIETPKVISDGVVSRLERLLDLNAESVPDAER
jgi:hypothetical protein